MSEVSESVLVEASLAEAWDLYFDPNRWTEWVDGFGSIATSEGYPAAGGTLRWISNPSGRGEVHERVLEHEPRGLHRIAFVDPQSEGELRTTFSIEGSGVRVSQALRYALRGGGIFGRISDLLFIRSQQRGSLRRSLGGLKSELEHGAGNPGTGAR